MKDNPSFEEGIVLTSLRATCTAFIQFFASLMCGIFGTMLIQLRCHSLSRFGSEKRLALLQNFVNE